MFQVIIGGKGPICGAKPGDMVLADVLDMYNDWPRVGQLLQMDGDECQIHWWWGAMTRKWTPALRNKEPWVDTIPSHSIYHFGFKLESGKCLPGAVQEKARLYREMMLN